MRRLLSVLVVLSAPAAAQIAPHSDAAGVWVPAVPETHHLNGPVRAIASAPDGSVYVGGSFIEAGGTPLRRVARWRPGAPGEAGTWEPLGEGLSGASEVRALAVKPDGSVYVGGVFEFTGGVPAQNVARWVPDASGGGHWEPLGSGVNGPVNALAVAQDGSVYVGGQFATAGGVPTTRVARWTPDGAGGGAWAPLGAGAFPPPWDWVRTLLTHPDGSVYVGGFFWGGGPGGSSPNT